MTRSRRYLRLTAAAPLALGVGMLGAALGGGAVLAAPCAPGMRDRKSPCNPCAAKKPMMHKGAMKNPCAAKKPMMDKGATNNPCHPKKMMGNPCHPAKPMNPCHPGAKKMMDKQGALPPARAKKIYAALLPTLKKIYQSGGHFVADGRWATWKNFAKYPYAGSTHGGRYLVNYANPIAAKVYGQYEKLRHMPPGGIIVKPSFTLKNGRPRPGPLFIMEKMRKGWNPATKDWRYAMILPGGKTFGVTKGANGAKVAFCHQCHVGAGQTDALMFLPEEARVR